MEFNTYRLKNGKQPLSWQLPLTEILVPRIVEGNPILKKIKFVPGENSYFAEDIKGDVESKQIWFNRGKIRVSKMDKLKNDILQNHPWFNKHYELYTPESDAKKRLVDYETKAKARKLVDESDSDQLQAVALAIFNLKALKWDKSTCKLQLYELAENDPETLMKELNSPDYESKYIAALAISKGIMVENLGKSSVVWNDTTKGEVVKLAKGENGILKLGDFLATETEESNRVLQEIMIRVKKNDTSTEDDLDEKLSEKDKEIAELKALLASKEQEESESENEEKLVEARKNYLFITKKKAISPRYINDLDWLTENTVKPTEK